jgi:hypothetical protein
MIEFFRSAHRSWQARLLTALVLAAIVCCGGLVPVVAHAQVSVVSTPPPGTSATDLTQVGGWVRYLFGIIAVVLIVVGCISIAKHPATGIFELMGALLCILIAGSANSIVTALYHGGTG